MLLFNDRVSQPFLKARHYAENVQGKPSPGKRIMRGTRPQGPLGTGFQIVLDGRSRAGPVYTNADGGRFARMTDGMDGTDGMDSTDSSDRGYGWKGLW